MDGVQSSGRLVAGVSYDISGMGYPNPRTGRIDGFEADLARALWEKLFGAPGDIELAQVTDMVLSQLTITRDRAEQVDFSIPYWVTREGILIRKESGIKGFDDLKGKRIVITAGSLSLRRMRATLPEDKLIVTTLGIDNFRAVEKGEADAASDDLIDLSMMLRQADRPDDYEVIDIGDRFDPKLFGVGVKKGRQSLIDRLNPAIEEIKTSGKIDALMTENLASLGKTPA
jgi:putative glutamine transport system substrate-binding protein